MSADFDGDAAEYVLGTLDHDERTAFAARLANDPAARAAVTAWEGRLAGLAGSIVPIAPPSTVWPAIERALNRGAPPRLSVIDGGSPALPDSAARATRLQQSVRRWRVATLVSSAVAAALLVFVGIRAAQPPQEGESSYVAAINRGGDKPALLVRVDLRTHQVTVRPVAADAPAGKSLELWYIGAGQAPRSMGLVERAARSMPIPDGIKTEAASFAVSVEPPGGSTTGGPTGPVVYSGQLFQE